MFAGSDRDSCVSLRRSSSPSGSLGSGLPKASQAGAAQSRGSSALEQGQISATALDLRRRDKSLVYLQYDWWGIWFPLSSLRVLGAAVWGRLCRGSTLPRLLLRCRRQLLREIVRGRAYGFCSSWDNRAWSYRGNVRRLQEVGAHGGGQEPAYTGRPGLRWQWRWSHSHPTLQAQRAGTEVPTTSIHSLFVSSSH